MIYTFNRLNGMNGLCDDLLITIMQNFNQQELCVCMYVCKRWLKNARSRPVCLRLLATMTRMFPSLNAYEDMYCTWSSLCAIGNIDFRSGRDHCTLIKRMCTVQIPPEHNGNIHVNINKWAHTYLVSIKYGNFRIVRTNFCYNPRPDVVKAIVYPFYRLLRYGYVDKYPLFNFYK